MQNGHWQLEGSSYLRLGSEGSNQLSEERLAGPHMSNGEESHHAQKLWQTDTMEKEEAHEFSE